MSFDFLSKESKPIARLKLLERLGIPGNAIQDRFILCPARFKVFRGSRRVGKSFTAAKDVFLDFLLPNTRGWIVAPSYDLAAKEFRYVLEFYKKAIRKFRLPPLVLEREDARHGELCLKTAWGSEVIGKSADSQKSLQGEELDWMIVAEAACISKEIWERRLFACLTSRKGRAVFATTPDASRGLWLYKLEKASLYTDDWEVFACPAWEAPHFDKEEIELARRNLTPGIFNEQYGGDWFLGDDDVFPEWKGEFMREVSISNQLTPFVIGFDAGAAAKHTVGAFIYRLPVENKAYIEDLYVGGSCATSVHVQRLQQQKALKVGRYVGMAFDTHALGAQLVKDYRKGFRPVYPATSVIEKRRDIFKLLLHRNQIIVSKKCRHLIAQIEDARYGSNGKISTEAHAIDAVEYALEVLNRKSHLIPKEDMGRLAYRWKDFNRDISGYYISKMNQGEDEWLLKNQ